jgi:hypothetical protein
MPLVPLFLIGKEASMLTSATCILLGTIFSIVLFDGWVNGMVISLSIMPMSNRLALPGPGLRGTHPVTAITDVV